MEAPNSKLQAPEKLQTSTSKQIIGAEFLKFGAWMFSGCWMLVLGAFPRATISALFHPQSSILV
jgi:membrane-associated PAP2 superfamily phosphatase